MTARESHFCMCPLEINDDRDRIRPVSLTEGGVV
jgi:hypothetical protein